MAGSPAATAALAALAVLAVVAALVVARLQASVARLDAAAAHARALAASGAAPSESLQRAPADRPRECLLDDLYQRQTRLHTLFNAHHAAPFSCGPGTTPEIYVVCQELRRAVERRGLGGGTAAAELVPVATWPDRLFGTQYLFDVRVATGAVWAARVVDDARYQLQVELEPPGADPAARRLWVIMALYNRGAQLRQWAEALAAAPAADKAADRTVLCVADFGSTDVDVEQVLQSTGFAYRLLQLPGRFAKTRALNACLDTVDGAPAEQLVFTTDVDVTLPPDFACRIRRFTRPGRQVYAPVVLYENCTWSSDPALCWGDGGYGLVGYGLEDARAVGGYAEALFNYREGFEDTDFLLRLFRLPRLLVRRKEPDMIHRYHERSAWKDAQNEGPLAEQPLPRVC